MRFTSKIVSFAAVFAALHTALYLVSIDLWRSWSIYLEPLEGIILGPWIGFLVAFMGSVTARAIKTTDLWMFGIIAEPMGVMACGLLAKGRWKSLLAIYAVMLSAYFVHPYGQWLPFWTILDILAAFVLIYPTAKIFADIDEEPKRLVFIVPLIAFIGTVTDALVRVFLLIPCGLHVVLGWSPEVVYGAFITGAAASYIEDVQVVLVAAVTGAPILKAIKKVLGLKYPLS